MLGARWLTPVRRVPPKDVVPVLSSAGSITSITLGSPEANRQLRLVEGMWQAIRVSPVCSRAFAYEIQAHLGPMVAPPNLRSNRSWAITR